MTANAPIATINGISVFKDFNPAASCMRLDSKTDYEYVAEQILLRSLGPTRLRQDAGLPVVFARQLEHVFAKVYEAEYPEYKAEELFPVNSEVDPGALSFTYRMVNRTGQAAVVSQGTAKDLPNISIEGEEWPSPVITLGASYEFNVIEQASSGKAGIAIEAMKAKATRAAIEELEEVIFALGFAAAGVPGVTNCLGVAATPKVSTGTWQAQIAAGGPISASNPFPMAGVAASLQLDLAAMKTRVYTQSKGKRKITKFILPPNLYGMVDNVPQSPAFNGKRLLAFLEETLNVTIEDWSILLEAGSVAGSTDDVTGSGAAHNTRIIGLMEDPEVMQLIRAQTFIQLAPQPTGLAWQIPCYSRIGGAMSVRPVGITYMDGC